MSGFFDNIHVTNIQNMLIKSLYVSLVIVSVLWDTKYKLYDIYQIWVQQCRDKLEIWKYAIKYMKQMSFLDLQTLPQSSGMIFLKTFFSVWKNISALDLNQTGECLPRPEKIEHIKTEIMPGMKSDTSGTT